MSFFDLFSKTKPVIKVENEIPAAEIKYETPIKKYKDSFGNVVVYDTQLYKEEVDIDRNYLRYIGPTDVKIRIPDGLQDCYRLFEGNRNLTYPPLIPYGVVSCKQMFKDCIKLEKEAALPATVKDTDGMYKGCPIIKYRKKEMTLEKFTDKFGVTVEYDPALFKVVDEGGTKRLWYIGPQNVKPVIPTGITCIDFMFKDNTALVTAPDMPEGIKSCKGTYYGCTALKDVGRVPDSAQDCDIMFAKCTSLTEAPTVPKGASCMGMFDGCSYAINKDIVEAGLKTFIDASGRKITYSPIYFEERKDTNGMAYLKYIGPQDRIPDIPKGLTSINHMFEDCTEMTDSPEIPHTVETCIAAYKGCVNLKHAPIIPYGVINCAYMFDGCTSLEKGSMPCTTVEICTAMYRGTAVDSTQIPRKAAYCSEMYAECPNLSICTTLPAGLLDAKNMFRNSPKFQRCAKPPMCLAEYTGMFAGTQVSRDLVAEFVEQPDRLFE